ncbi:MULTISPECIES: hypothetical protein [Delftia]|uniref:Uncharacterized protein n=1 Tax=Delftia tsuruhatensis TaxID=180282 RepID=A0AAX3SV54_9BURK|nr:hypothetical protein [Delftia tsuruhatensis]WFF83794.1 hypothetical protein PYR84_14175 [Delftia tsuruhatensis]
MSIPQSDGECPGWLQSGRGLTTRIFPLIGRLACRFAIPNWGGSLSGGKHRNNLLSDLFFFVSGNYIYLEWPLE